MYAFLHSLHSREFSKNKSRVFNESFASVGRRVIDKIKDLARYCDFISNNVTHVSFSQDSMKIVRFTFVQCPKIENIIKVLLSHKLS